MAGFQAGRGGWRLSGWAAAAGDLRPNDRAPGLLTGPDVVIADDAVIGAYVVIYGAVTIGAGAQIQDHATLGKPSLRGPGASAIEPTSVGDGVVVGTGAIVYAGARLAARSFVGDVAVVRDRSVLGEDSLLAGRSSLGVGCEIGSNVSIQVYSSISQFAIVEDDVFIGPYFVAVNDNSLARHDGELQRVRLRRACRIAGNVQINPGIEVGEESFIAAASLVTRDVPRRAKMLGTPARQVGEVSDAELLENWR